MLVVFSLLCIVAADYLTGMPTHEGLRLWFCVWSVLSIFIAIPVAVMSLFE
jgi:hypothetical protein